MQVLEALAETPGEVVTREQLVARVWPDVFVSDDVLHRAIRELRKAFGDETAKPAYVETIRKRGYRLIAPVGPAQARPSQRPWSAGPTSHRRARPPRPFRSSRSNRFVAVASIVLAGVLGAVVFALASRPAPDRAVIVFGALCRDDLGSAERDRSGDQPGRHAPRLLDAARTRRDRADRHLHHRRARPHACATDRTSRRRSLSRVVAGCIEPRLHPHRWPHLRHHADAARAIDASAAWRRAAISRNRASAGRPTATGWSNRLRPVPIRSAAGRSRASRPPPACAKP